MSNITIGQELEFLFTTNTDTVKTWDIPNLIAKCVGDIYSCKSRDYSKPNVHIDRGGELEIVSSVHTDIGSLYHEMSRLTVALEDVCDKNGFKLSPRAYGSGINTNKKKTGAANQVSVVLPNWKKDTFSFIDEDGLNLVDLHAALNPYVPLFVALTNNSSTEEFPFGSERLRQGSYGNFFYGGNSFAKAIRFNNNSQTLEVRAMDKSVTLEKDLAAAAIVFATVKYLHDVNYKRDDLSGGETTLEEKTECHTHRLYGSDFTEEGLFMSFAYEMLRHAEREGIQVFNKQLKKMFSEIDPYIGDIPLPVKVEIDKWKETISS